MKEIIANEPDGPGKCPACRQEAGKLYRFEDEDEDTAACGSCFFETILEMDLDIADEHEVVVNKIVTELVDNALAELSSGELYQLEDTLHSINDQIPESNATSTPIDA
ncbi:hypothetical protein [Halosimplex pelagicum]|uniref:Uncharacterized protein n=1 Tax=Halosimplex pelagicum TaxID=869886 RepID=A0A7D5PCG1_9EURY|nr:hypothetical protein [Halosimplex pelagicum]QLH82318.1 hypothetical protein HZS54_12145 [Halosimplex pelagicum]